MLSQEWRGHTAVETKQIAVRQVELAGCYVLEIFSPEQFTEQAGVFGLQPGFAVDPSEQKPYGPTGGEYLDSSRQRDLKELEGLVDYEDPLLITVSPPCDLFRSYCISASI